MKINIKPTYTNYDPDADLIPQDEVTCKCKCHNEGQFLKEMCEKCRNESTHELGAEIDCDCRCHKTWCADCEKNHRMIPKDENPIIKVTLSYKGQTTSIEMCLNDSDKSIAKAFRSIFKIEPAIELSITKDSPTSYRAE